MKNHPKYDPFLLWTEAQVLNNSDLFSIENYMFKLSPREKRRQFGRFKKRIKNRKENS